MYYEAVSFVSGEVEVFAWVDEPLAFQEYINSKESTSVIQTKLYNEKMELIESSNGKGKKWLKDMKLGIGGFNV